MREGSAQGLEYREVGITAIALEAGPRACHVSPNNPYSSHFLFLALFATVRILE